MINVIKNTEDDKIFQEFLSWLYENEQNPTAIKAGYVGYTFGLF